MHCVYRCHQRLCRHTPKEHEELFEVYTRLLLVKSGRLDDEHDERELLERLARLVDVGRTEHTAVGEASHAARNDSVIGYMGTSDSPRLLKDIRLQALSRWEAALIRNHGRAPGRPCRCGHTRAWHDLYHQREDGEWEACWCESGDCGFKERCDVCDCMEFTAVQEQPART